MFPDGGPLPHFPSFSEISPKFSLDLRSPSAELFQLGNPTPEAFWLSEAGLLPSEGGSSGGVFQSVEA